MSYKQNVEENLQHFAESIGLGELSLNEHDACGLCFDDTLIVNMEYLEEDEALVFVSSVKPMDAHDDARTQLFEKLLSLNLQHHSMQGAFVALNHDKTEVLLIRSMLASSDYGNFESTLEKFVNTLEWIVSEVDNVDENSTPAAGTSAPQPGPGGPGDMGMMV
ncbi:type III secretion system chaperone [Endozoicomonas gorgoniicola]|uniref:Type III secretion system chaperone n=1 Tax=Endozoicomonas gorgoniicola TaxID=1234144 RepID=A0ABT3MX88_9GAMM|nr:type III secretion system chaperone [Endozoicomonas gorgoniicola]MCW7553997.1 type III secretion system chaperone [Endozoicomonas gorgoniicola]